MVGELHPGHPLERHSGALALKAIPGGGVTELPQILDLTQAKPLRETLAALLHEGSVVLDAGGVERMSTPCAQVLLAAGRASVLATRSFKICNASEVFQVAIADLGLQTAFADWMV